MVAGPSLSGNVEGSLPVGLVGGCTNCLFEPPLWNRQVAIQRPLFSSLKIWGLTLNRSLWLYSVNQLGRTQANRCFQLVLPNWNLGSNFCKKNWNGTTPVSPTNSVQPKGHLTSGKQYLSCAFWHLPLSDPVPILYILWLWELDHWRYFESWKLNVAKIVDSAA